MDAVSEHNITSFESGQHAVYCGSGAAGHAQVVIEIAVLDRDQVVLPVLLESDGSGGTALGFDLCLEVSVFVKSCQ
jgi:hypothetical protein